MSMIVIGSAGVGLLLIAFILNLLRILPERSAGYLLMNVIGAALAAWYAIDGKVYPFVILESVWALTALVRLLLLWKQTALR
jgi:hypothetical protein